MSEDALPAGSQRPILMFDSGIGGLTVLREARVLMPDRRFVYVADDAAFPYGDWEEEALRARLIVAVRRIAGDPPAGNRGHPLQHGLDAGARRSARRLSRHAFRRHRAGDQARGRAHALRAGVGAGDARHGQARLYARPHPVVCRAMPRPAGRQPEPGAHGGSLHPWRNAGRWRGACRDRAVLRREATASAPTSSCSPARTIRSSPTSFAGWRHGRSTGSIRPRRSPGGRCRCWRHPRRQTSATSRTARSSPPAIRIFRPAG